jgi:hypothetical protein
VVSNRHTTPEARLQSGMQHTEGCDRTSELVMAASSCLNCVCIVSYICKQASVNVSVCVGRRGALCVRLGAVPLERCGRSFRGPC